MQALLADVGLAAGFDVWVPTNDRARVEAEIVRPGLAQVWPAQALPESLDAVVRNIDVIWLQDGIVTHCYEVEHSTSVTTGIARIRDAQSRYLNFFIPGYIVGEGSKRRKYDHEVHRPSLDVTGTWSEMRPIAFIDQEHLRDIGETAASEWLTPSGAQQWLDQYAIA